MFNVPEFSVSEFSASIKRVVEDAFGYVRIRGEIGGYKRASSGHLYFSLKDKESILSAVCFKNSAEMVDFEMADGLQIVASGRISTFGGRSNYQIIVEKVEIAGIGAILEMIEKRRQKLAQEGLFDEIHKKKLPFFPRRIGVITSETGAVIQDILHRVEGRGACHVMLYPSAVQGKNAAKDIVKAIKFFDKMKGDKRPDVLIIARGGGSFEDLLPFSDEEMVRAVFACEIPVISAIGHETDTTLIDYVSDMRAPTPTAAAEFATVILADLKEGLLYYEERIEAAKSRILGDKAKQIESLARYVINPANIIAKIIERFNNLDEKMKILLKNNFSQKQKDLSSINFSTKVILGKINAEEKRVFQVVGLLNSRVSEFIKNSQIKLENLQKLLEAKNYQEILKRGFCLLKNKNGKLISSISQIKIKEEIDVEMAGGAFSSYVLNIKKQVAEDILPDKNTQPKLI